jgi:hypothetical protein
MTTVKRLNDDVKLKNNKFNTFEDLLNEVEDFKLGKIMKQNNNVSFDIDLLEKKYL